MVNGKVINKGRSKMKLTKEEKNILDSIIDELQVVIDADTWSLDEGCHPDYIEQTRQAIKYKYRQLELLEKIKNNG